VWGGPEPTNVLSLRCNNGQLRATAWAEPVCEEGRAREGWVAWRGEGAHLLLMLQAIRAHHVAHTALDRGKHHLRAPAVKRASAGKAPWGRT